MPRRAQVTLSKRTVDALRVKGDDAVFWDRDLPGFGVRVYPSGRRIFVVQCRGPAGIRRVSLGPYGELSCEQARSRARAAIDRIKRGEQARAPAPEPAFTVAELAERYMEAHVAVNCNAHTQGICRGSLRNHILPALGSMPVAAVGRPDAEALHYSLRATPRAANRALGVLSKMFALAEDWGLTPPGDNPCRFVARYRERMRERFLSADEYRRAGRALRESGGPERAAGACGGGAAAADGHRVPADRGAHAAMGRRRPQGGGAAVARFQRYRRWRATRIWQAIRCGNRRPGWPGASARICGLAHRRRRLAGAERGPGTAARTRRRKHGCAGGRDRSLPIGASMWSISARSGWNPCGISRLWPQAFLPRASCIARGGMVGYAHLAPGGVGSSRA